MTRAAKIILALFTLALAGNFLQGCGGCDTDAAAKCIADSNAKSNDTPHAECENLNAVMKCIKKTERCTTDGIDASITACKELYGSAWEWHVDDDCRT